MLTKRHWEQLPHLRTELDRLLTDNEALSAALEVCLSTEINYIDPRTHEDSTAAAALSGANREGYFRFYRTLIALAQEPKPAPKEIKPWGHVSDPR